MSKAIITDNDLLKEEIKALYNYANRDEFNLNVVEVMINEIQDIVKGLKPCEKIDSSKQIIYPECHSIKVSPLYGTINCDDINHQIVHTCETCHNKFCSKKGE